MCICPGGEFEKAVEEEKAERREAEKSARREKRDNAKTGGELQDKHPTDELLFTDAQAEAWAHDRQKEGMAPVGGVRAQLDQAFEDFLGRHLSSMREDQAQGDTSSSEEQRESLVEQRKQLLRTFWKQCRTMHRLTDDILEPALLAGVDAHTQALAQ